jgi:hypothetical protein
MESDGIKALMHAKGLTPELIGESLVDDIQNKAGNRLGELALGAKIL